MADRNRSQKHVARARIILGSADRVSVAEVFSALTRRRIRRGSFHSIVDLQAAIHRYVAEHNADPKPFTWTKSSQQILAKLTPLNVSVH